MTAPTQRVRNALRQLAAVDDTTLSRLTAGSPLTRTRLRQALVTGALSPADLDQALHHAQAHPQQLTNTALDQGGTGKPWPHNRNPDSRPTTVDTKTGEPTVNYLADALGAIPGCAELEHALKALDGWRPDTTTDEHLDPGQAARLITDAARNGQAIPTGLGQKLLTGQHYQQANQAELEAVAAARAQLTEEKRLAQVNGIDHALTFLRGHLDELLGETGGLVATLGDATTAERAIDAGPDATAAWQRLGQLADTYSDIRAAQRSLVEIRYGGLATSVDVSHSVARHPLVLDVLRVSGHLANLDVVWPHWRPSRTRQAPPEGWTVPDTSPPWSVRDDRWPLDPVINREYLVWLASSDAMPWLPDIRQMVDNYAQQHTAADERHAADLDPDRVANRTPAETARTQSDVSAELAAHRSLQANAIPTART